MKGMVSCEERNFHTGMESSETSRVLIGRKRAQCVWRDTWVSSQRACLDFLLSVLACLYPDPDQPALSCSPQLSVHT